eukprot:c13179_g1_i1.p1 GENE.c13179_g1_i1~~c13179_g1_i1.p1  ORF type:complete len:229 (-),score=79.44 c13179_g1_i1:23-688(-)
MMKVSIFVFLGVLIQLSQSEDGDGFIPPQIFLNPQPSIPVNNLASTTQEPGGASAGFTALGLALIPILNALSSSEEKVDIKNYKEQLAQGKTPASAEQIQAMVKTIDNIYKEPNGRGIPVRYTDCKAYFEIPTYWNKAPKYMEASPDWAKKLPDSIDAAYRAEGVFDLLEIDVTTNEIEEKDNNNDKDDNLDEIEKFVLENDKKLSRLGLTLSVLNNILNF